VNREIAVWGSGLLWLGSVVAAIFGWERYDATPGRMAPRVVDSVTTHSTGWNLTVYAHPRCPCLRASFPVLRSLKGHYPHLTVRVVFVRPLDTPDGWEFGEAWDEATRISGTTVTCDPDGGEARRAGAETSGCAVLTDPNGRVVFRGGLTQGRGRVGDSDGRRAVSGWVQGEPSAASVAVYGCPLHTSLE